MRKPSIDSEKLKSGLSRAAWLTMAILFVVTALGAGVVYFWQATHPSDQSQDQTQSQNLLKGKPLANFTPVAKLDSLQKIDNKVGDGNEVKPTSTVTVLYTGALASNGTVFESSTFSNSLFV